MSAIEEARTQLHAVVEAIEALWDEAAGLKENAGTCADDILEVTGTDMPELASIPHNQLVVAQGLIEQAQELFTSAKESLETYIESLG
jgi:hypothetical protein